ncbi:hypothetical protein ACIQAC_38045 [Streptomyces sp. NPDC088387]|uniref:hypothetical protein n=1 Tax=Streptomyces sp. NPDC088387 TaxID=3365859 RepID=UPI00381DCCAE
MPEHLSTLQWTVLVLLGTAAVGWLFGVARVLRFGRTGRAGHSARHPGHADRRALLALPRQRQSAPQLESVELTPAEQDAFAGLVRNLADGR